MAHTHINTHPKMTQYLVKRLHAFASAPMIICDVGARGGIEPHWNAYDQQLVCLGFEPDVAECERLNQLNQLSSKPKVQFYTAALGRQREQRLFSLCRLPGGSSFYPANHQFLQRFPSEHAQALEVVKTIELETTDLDSFAQSMKFPAIDFIKLDVEGSELDVLKGATTVLQESVLGLSLEVLFHDALRSQPTFSQIDLFLSSLGFKLFDLDLYRYARNTLALPTGTLGDTRMGQVLWAQALYLRDGVEDLQSKNLRSTKQFAWDKTRILKLASLMEVFSLQDCAIELLQVGASQLEYDIKNLIELLLPSELLRLSS
ncbi:FkbM family methyltransferase [Leptolyngbya sp. GGD]|uniref:FkbM family methyltransferase n=1 Tax=Leptolyngbya sp. GGD TaxID=2997907 RepID=UPI00227A1245|nr:FkbM family methyltransferase [Leptolyngbya sp. GGD]MCY6490365.1 FkbM family methyltransferase [Leptolyngbya sp. GGD]